MSTQVTRGPGLPRRRASSKAARTTRSVPRRVMIWVSVATSSPSTMPAAERGEEPLGALADDDQVDGGVARQRAGNTRQPPRGADPRVQVELAAEGDLGGQLGAVRAADVGQAAGAQEDRVGLAAGRQRRGGQVLPALEVSPRAGRGRQEREVEAAHEPPGRVQHVDPAGHDLGADAVPFHNRDLVRSSHRR